MAGPPPEHPGLNDFQAALLELLASPLTPQEMMHRLHHDPAFAPYRDYITTFEPRMVEVAAGLTRKWGRREGSRREAGIPISPAEPVESNEV